MTQSQESDINKYIPVCLTKPIGRNVVYEKRHNIWRHNVPRRINFNRCVPDWFKDLNSLIKPKKKNKQTFNKTKATTYLSNPTYLKPSWISRLIKFIKRLFHYGKKENQ
jgi:hypothetical protein